MDVKNKKPEKEKYKVFPKRSNPLHYFALSMISFEKYQNNRYSYTWVARIEFQHSNEKRKIKILFEKTI